MHTRDQTLTCLYTQTLTYIYRRLDSFADFDIYMQTLTYIYLYVDFGICTHVTRL